MKSDGHNYRTDSNNNRTFCINHTHLITADFGVKKWILAQFTIEIVLNSNRIQGQKGTWNQ